MRRPVLLAALAAAVLPALLGPAGGTAQAAAEKRPIVFVHGWNSSAATWDTMVSRFTADGWPADRLSRWSYLTSQSNAITAQELQQQVAALRTATGATKVDVVTHSMGGLSARYFVRNLGGDVQVDDWVSLGGPNHGTDTAYFCLQTSCREMRPGSAFLGALNATDETPGSVAYWTWWSPCDTTINPDSSVALSGATNTRTACLSHSALRTDATVYAQVKNAVDD